MARTGKFGRLPRSMPSLGATLIAIAREQENQRDQNLMDAWQKGGMFEGQKATDEVVLAHWKERLNGIAKDDPLYDTYKNAVTQYEYSIAESKMTVKYAQGKISDGEAAKFYLDWAKRIPTDSEFYRTLQRDAAQYMRAAKAKSDANKRALEEQKYNDQMGSIEKSKEAPGQYALDIITQLAQKGSGGQGAILGETPLGNQSNIASTTNIGDIQLPAIDDLMGLLQTVSVGGTSAQRPDGGRMVSQWSGSPEVLFHDEAGSPVTGTQIIAALKASDPTFSGHFDVNYVRTLIANQKNGLQDRIALAKKTGHVNDMMQLQVQLAKVNEYGNQVAAWPVLQSYSDLKQQLDSVMKDDGLLPAAKIAAIDSIRTQIGSLANDPRIAADDHLQSQLRGEASGAAGTVTASEDMTGAQTGYTNAQTPRTSEVENINSMRDLLNQQVEATTGPNATMVMTQGDYVSDGQGGVVFKPSPGGHAVGAATMDDIHNLPSAGDAITVLVPNGDGGGATPMVLVPAPVTGSAKAADGTNVLPTNKNPICSFVKYKVNGVDVTLYGIKDSKSGATRWTTDPPWDPNKVKTSETNAGMNVDLTGVRPTADTTGLTGGDIAGSPGWSVTGKHGASRGQAVNSGKITFDPATAALSTDPTRDYLDPNTDSFSPTLIALKSSPDGIAILNQLAGTDAFRSIIDTDAHKSAGMTFDANTQTWNGNAQQTSLYNGFHTQATMELDKAKAGGPRQTVFPGKEADDSMIPTGTFTQPQGKQSSTQGPTGLTYGLNGSLPADALRAAGDQRFAALYDRFQPNSNAIKPLATGGTNGLTINAPSSLVVPQNPFSGPYTPPPISVPTLAPPSQRDVNYTPTPVSTPTQPAGGKYGSKQVPI